MHASSGQENITCGETARGPKEGGKQRIVVVVGVKWKRRDQEGIWEGILEGRGVKGAEQQKGIERKVKRE